MTRILDDFTQIYESRFLHKLAEIWNREFTVHRKSLPDSDIKLPLLGNLLIVIIFKHVCKKPITKQQFNLVVSYMTP
jgi:hypothetical protein